MPSGGMGATGDKESPQAISGRVTAIPARGPAAPTSMRALRDRIRPRMRITAPAVPMRRKGTGMK